MSQLDQANALIRKLAGRMNRQPVPGDIGRPVYAGVDIGTANVVSVAVDASGTPLAGEITPAHVVKEGIVVDYHGALDIVAGQIRSLGKRLGINPEYAASAIPPGTETGNVRVTRNIVEDAGLKVTGIVDEPAAASLSLGIREGAVVDVGGGTTGISVLKEGEVIYSADEPTGGFQLDLVIAGHFGISTEEAESRKRDPLQQPALFAVIRPVIEKIAFLIRRHTAAYRVENLYLVGGTCSFSGFCEVIERETGIRTHLPDAPHLVTPLGIALACRKYMETAEKG